MQVARASCSPRARNARPALSRSAKLAEPGHLARASQARGRRFEPGPPLNEKRPDPLGILLGGSGLRRLGGLARGQGRDKRSRIFGEPEPVDLRAQVVGREVAVAFSRQPRVAVPEDALHRGRIGARHHQERSGAVPHILEAELPDLRLGPELRLVLGAAAKLRVGRLLRVAAARAPADVVVACHDSRPAHGAAKHLLEVAVGAHHRAVLGRENQLGQRGRDGPLQIGHQLSGDGNHVSVAALGGVPVVGARDRQQAAREVHVGLAQAQQLTLPEPRVEGGGEERAPPQCERGQKRARSPLA